MPKQRISYVPLEQMDAAMRQEMERCQREGTPRPESSAVRAHVPACFWFFANSWRDIFRNGVSAVVAVGDGSGSSVRSAASSIARITASGVGMNRSPLVRPRSRCCMDPPQRAVLY